MAAARLLLLDSATLYYRAFHALPTSLTGPDGRPNNAVRGFCDGLLALVKAAGATDLICAWDTDWRPQWRVDLWPGYKAHRVRVDADAVTAPGLADAGAVAGAGTAAGTAGATAGQPAARASEAAPDELDAQIDTIAGLLDAAGIARLGAEGFEADDVIATVAARHDGEVVIATSDRDLLQCVTEDRRVQVLSMAKGLGALELLGPAQVMAAYGVPPQRYIDLAALRGDPSDGLPGVPGVGVKTAAALVARFGDVDGILAAASDPASEMTARVRSALLSTAETLPAWRAVTGARADLPLPTVATSLPRPASVELPSLAAAAGVVRQVDAWHGVLTE